MPTWSAEQMLQLLAAVSNNELKDTWAGLADSGALPEGRTLAACKIQYCNWKRKLAEEQESGTRSTVPASPRKRKPASSPRNPRKKVEGKESEQSKIKTLDDDELELADE